MTRRSRRRLLALAFVLWLAVVVLFGVGWVAEEREAPAARVPVSERLDPGMGRITMEVVVRDGGTLGWALLGGLAVSVFVLVEALLHRRSPTPDDDPPDPPVPADS